MSAPTPAALSWPATGVGRLYEAFDWSARGLPPPGQWPPVLRSTVDLMLRSRFPMFIVWGPERILLYNEGYGPILGSKHPDALGRSFWRAWPEVRETIEPIIEAAFKGEDSFFEDLEVTLVRDDGPAPAWFTFSYSPVLGEDGEIAAALCVCVETTATVLANRAAEDVQRRQLQRELEEARLRFLDRLSAAVTPMRDADEILATTTRMVGEHLGISCCAYADMDENQDGFTIRGDWSAPGSPSIVGHYSLADFGRLAVSNLSAGEPLVINNNLKELAPEEAKTFQDIGVTATICMPLVKDGRLTALMAIHDRVPHRWSDEELSLIREVTARSWAHVARVGAEERLRESEEQLRLAIDAGEVGLWDVDPLRDTLFWPPRVKAMFGISADAPVSMSEDFFPCLHPEDRDRVGAAWAGAVDPKRRALYDVEYRTIGKEDRIVRWVAAKGRGLFSPQGECYRVIGTAIDVTARKRAERRALHQARSLEVLNNTGAALAAELDLQKVVQLVTDAGVGITGAQFGAFFYNLLDDAGESYMLYALAGVDRAAFDKFPMPRNTDVFAPTFAGEAVVRVDDITQDPRYGRNAPRHGMPDGHLPVRSYLAVPVVSRSGEVIGGLFFGHAEVGVFTAAAEELVRGVAGQAAVAIDNARLYQAAQGEILQRRKIEEQQRLLINELNHRVKNTLATVQSIVAQTSRSGRSAQEMRIAIEGRLLALSRAHDLLTRHNWEGADLRDVVDRAIAPFNSAPDTVVRAQGPSVPLSPQKALAISMALHELATNASKYGALSTPAGCVELAWRRTPGGVELDWREHGGPPVTPPASRGFGSRLLERGLAGDLQGEVRLDFRPEGVLCVIRAPLGAEAPAQPLQLESAP